MSRRLRAALWAPLAFLIAVLTVTAAVQPAQPNASGIVVHAYTDDGPHHTALLTHTITERGPPALAANVTAYDADGQGPLGVLARRDDTAVSPAYDYNGSLLPGQVVGGSRAAEGQGRSELAEPALVARLRVAADAAGDGLSYSDKITKQMGPRGWSKDSISETVRSPETRHSVWDYTTGDKLPATAYVQRGGGYVVVSDESGEIVQVSDLTNPNWKPVWNDARFQR